MIRSIIRTASLVIAGIVLFIFVPIIGLAFQNELNFYLLIILWIVYTIVIIFLFSKLMSAESHISEIEKIKTQSAKIIEKEVEENTSKGIFGPTRREKIGGLIAWCIILIALNFVVFSSDHLEWWLIIIFNTFYLTLIYLDLFTNNVYLENKKLIYGPFLDKKKQEILISRILGIKKIYQTAGLGVPSPALSLENTSGAQFEVNIEKWSLFEVISFIKFIKEMNDSVSIDPIFEPLLQTFKTDEFASQAKAYTKNETQGVLKAALWILLPMIFFYGLLFLALELKD